MARIFISYRRSDASGYAGRLYDRLSSHFGADHVFIDVDHIEPGDDFARTIEERMRRADVVLALIGPRWLTASDDDGRVRLHLDDDYVRIEIATAIRQDKTVIPLLVEGTAIPDVDALPEELRPLNKRHGFSCSDERFHADVDRLIEKIEHKSGWFDRLRWGAGRVRRRMGSISRWSRFAAAAGALGSIAVIAGVQLGGFQDAGKLHKTRGYVPGPERASASRGYPSLPVLGQTTGRNLVNNRPMTNAQQREFVRRYNRTAKEIIDSMGR